MKKVIIFTGAGVSADSGISTFRNSDGLWANHRIEDVCTPEALFNNRIKVIDFYNSRRQEILSKEPNAGHIAIAKLERYYDVEVITQNIDDLHERAGSTKVTHLHGEIRKLRSSINAQATVNIEGWKQEYETRHKDGSLLRPFVVFFGESVPMFERAAEIVEKADILIVAGTSLAVYPAASLVSYTKPETPIYMVDPAVVHISNNLKNRIVHIKERGAIGLPDLIEKLIEQSIQK